MSKVQNVGGVMAVINSMTPAEKIEAFSKMSPEQLGALNAVPAPVDGLVPVEEYVLPGEDALNFKASVNGHVAMSCKGFKGSRTFNALNAVVLALSAKRQQRWLLANIESLNMEESERNVAAKALGAALGASDEAVAQIRAEQRAVLKKAKKG